MTLALLLVLGFFALGMLVRSFTRYEICALCAGISLAWLMLLGMHWSGTRLIDPVVLAVLMGGSAVGLMYYLAARAPARYSLFKLPFLVSALLAVYGVVRGAAAVEGTGIVLVVGLWIAFGALYVWRENPRLRRMSERLIACCKNW